MDCSLADKYDDTWMFSDEEGDGQEDDAWIFFSEEDSSESGDLTIGTKTKVGRPSVIEAHPEVVEIKKAVKERQKAVTSICDGVPDWTPKSTPNLIYFGRSRRDLNLDIFILTSYAQGHTRHNPIECSWAPLSKWLTSVTHPIALEEKTSPWVDFAGLNENKICNWKAEVVHEACCKCRYWDGKKIDCSFRSGHMLCISISRGANQ